MQLHPTDEDFGLPAVGLGPNGERAPDGGGRAVRLRVGLGAAVVLVLVAAGVAVVISAVSSHPASASASTPDAASYSASSGGASSGTSSGASAGGSASDPADSDSARSDASGATPATNDASAASDSSTALVQVVGQVMKPGLYELPAGDRIVDAIAAAGGFTAKANQASLNLAQVIADGQQIVVGQQGSAPVGAALAQGGTPIVDINTADATALETLDGIGPAMAHLILDYRTAHGGFRSIGDLQNVTGIGPAKFAAIKGSVSI